jgi:hypothetical protein
MLLFISIQVHFTDVLFKTTGEFNTVKLDFHQCYKIVKFVFNLAFYSLNDYEHRAVNVLYNILI